MMIKISRKWSNIGQNLVKNGQKIVKHWSIFFFYILDWPQLPPLPSETEEEPLLDHISDSSVKNRNPSGPKLVQIGPARIWILHRLITDIF